MPRSENKTTPKVESDYLYTDDVGCAVDSAGWVAWLKHEENMTFYYESPIGSFTARKETRRSGHFDRAYWYAYRKQVSKLHKLYLGRSEQLTAVRLVEAAQRLAE